MLKGDNVKPTLFNFFTKPTEEKPDDTSEALAVLTARKAQWDRFQNLKAYHIVSDVVDPTIEQFENNLRESVTSLIRRMPIDAVNEYRAECRGALEAWTAMKMAMLTLSAEIERLKGGVPKAKDLKKSLDKYR
jgi:hypothetical protein